METRLEKQTRWIASAYNGIGLYSIPCLTLVTVISMTNVFTSGYFSQYPFIGGLWAFIFAATIDVNIVRLFLESHCEKVKGRVSSARTTFWVALGLSIVTGVALFVEGLQQSIGLRWTDSTVKVSISLIIALRVVLVVVLMAREGCKLGAALVSHEEVKMVTEIVEEIHSIEAEREIPEASTQEEMVETEKKTPLRLISSELTETREAFSGSDVEAYMRLNTCSRATAYRRMKKERKQPLENDAHPTACRAPMDTRHIGAQGQRECDGHLQDGTWVAHQP